MTTITNWTCGAVIAFCLLGLYSTSDKREEQDTANYKAATIKAARTEHKLLMHQSNYLVAPLAQVEVKP